jgi:hypothetical protein
VKDLKNVPRRKAEYKNADEDMTDEVKKCVKLCFEKKTREIHPSNMVRLVNTIFVQTLL